MMPIAKFEMPDGRVARFEVPEGTTPEQAQMLIQQQLGGMSEPEQQAQPIPQGQPTMQQPVTAGQEAEQAGFGARNLAAFGAPVAQTYYGIKQLLGGGTLSPEDQQSVKDWQGIAGAAPVANIAGNIATMAIPAAGAMRAGGLAGAAGRSMLAPASAMQSAAGGAAYSALQPTESQGSKGMFERAGQAALGGVAGAGGFALGSKLGSVGIPKQMTPREVAAVTARQKGYSIPPREGGGIIGKAGEAISGKIKTDEAFRLANQSVTNAKAKAALGLPDDVTLNADVFKQLKAQAGQGYDAVRNVGTVKLDKQFMDAMDDITSKYRSASTAFPGLVKDDVADTIAMLKVPQADSAGMIDAVKVLREQADMAYRAGDGGKGRAIKQAAQEIENAIERHLLATNQSPSLIKGFKNSRKDYAKISTVEQYTNPISGDVDAKAMGRLIDKKKPITGDIKDIAEFGRTFKEISGITEKGANPFGWTDYAAGAGGGTLAALSGNPAGLAIAASPLLRIGARQAIVSPQYQSQLAKSGAANLSSLARIGPTNAAAIEASRQALLRSLLAPAAVGMSQ